MVVVTTPMEENSPKPPSVAVLGVRLDLLSIVDLHALLDEAIKTRRQIIVVSQNLHGVHLFHCDAAIRRLHERAYVRIDGMPLVFWGRLLGHTLQRSHRVTWVDWMPQLFRRAATAGWKVYYLGSKPGVAERGVAVFQREHSKLQIETHHGYFDLRPDGEENAAVIEMINSSKADVLLVGMGMPRQERWVLENAERLGVPVILTCGAAIDYFASAVPMPPRWMGGVGLEWAYRLWSEPRRLSKRYLVEPWTLLPIMARDVVARLKAALDSYRG
jgi:N-acetylglucosaminyldiphosphoundecaprenol N-acetyl-beta-D-mannosaminyltransferase